MYLIGLIIHTFMIATIPYIAIGDQDTSPLMIRKSLSDTFSIENPNAKHMNPKTPKKIDA
tara:strand:+ start:1722 stop:1901 length:180 start_codon:yes stop_codon:yes gene_type:complete